MPVGLDTASPRRDLEAYDARYDDAGLLSQQVDAGRLGAKSGAGFFEGRPRKPRSTQQRRRWRRRSTPRLGMRRSAVWMKGIAAEQDVDPAMRFGCGWSEGPLTAAGA
ncbi:MAG: hypothetical protein R2878_05665 [Thermoleophilia bacterium]